MLQLFRSRTRAIRILLALFVAPVILTMVITLIPGVGSGTSMVGGDEVLAEVGGENVTINEASAEFQDFIQQQRIPVQAYSFVLPKVVDDLILEKAMLQEAERLGLGVTEEELVGLLRTAMPYLFQGGAFVGKDQYAAHVQERFRKTIPQFEDALRRDLILTKLRHLVTDNISVPPQELAREFQQRNEKARIDYVTVSAAALKSSITSTQAEIEQQFQKNPGIYSFPERRSLSYAVIDDAVVAARVQISPQEIEQYYNQNRERFRVQERARVSHILFKTTEKSPEEVKKIEAKAQDVLKQVRAGKDFAALAKENSEDAGSAAKGGEVGWITRGQTVPEFEQRAFSMKPGEISDLVKTQYGFHIIKALEREEARMKPLAEVEPAIRQELSQDRLEREKSRLADAVRSAVARHGQNVAAASKDAGIPFQSVSLLERAGQIPGLGSQPNLMDAVFSAPKGGVVGPIVMTGRSVVAVVTDISPARPAQLSEVMDRVRDDANTAKARQVAEARAKELLNKAKAGDLRVAAREMRLEVKTSDLFTRDGSITDLGSAMSFAQAFTAPVGTLVGPVAAGNNQVVYRVAERQLPDTPPTEEEKRIIRDTVVGNRQNEAFELYREALRARLQKEGKLKIFQDRVDRFVNNRRV